jgi:predicted enzyme related to lactoylglutathione lyase
VAGQPDFYFAVDDLAKYNRRIEKAGGKIHVEEQEIPGMGSLSLFTDPEGRMNGLFKPMMQAKKTKKKKK